MRPTWLRWFVPAGVFVLLMTSAAGDSFFRDEYYYLACARHLAWGYVDQPPLSIALLWAVVHVLGDSLLAVRLVPALAAAGTVSLVGSLARRLGASEYGGQLAMLCCAVAPVLLAIGSYFSMNVLDVLLWTLAARTFVAVIDRPDDRRWLVLGLVLGLGLLNKISVLWLGAGLAAALVATRSRRLLLTRGPWIAALVAAACLLPHLLWQIRFDWPTLEFVRNASRDKMLENPPLAFLRDQAMNMNPFTLPIWLGGLIALLVSRRLRPYRGLAVIFLVVLAILLLNRTSRSSYLAVAFPMLCAAGGAAWDALPWSRSTLLRTAVVVWLLAGGAISTPLALPLLSTDRYVRYTTALGMRPSAEERNSLGRLPQFFADRQNWGAIVDAVAEAWRRLGPDERAEAVILTGNYGEAGAIDYLGRSRDLPGAISGHNNYWLWGPGSRTGDVAIVLSRSPERLRKTWATVEAAGETSCGDCMPYENHLPIYICHKIRTPLPQLWAALKHYD